MAECPEPIEVLHAFTNGNGNKDVLGKIMSNADPAVAALALENLIHIEDSVESHQFDHDDDHVHKFLQKWLGDHENPLDSDRIMSNTDPTVAVLALDKFYREDNGHMVNTFDSEDDHVLHFLRKWRCESPLNGAYVNLNDRQMVPKFLRSLTIFITLKVPLFIDNYGKKELLSNYHETDPILIDGNTPIFHDTHKAEAEKISDEQQFEPSNNKNIEPGCWFGLGSPSSAYGGKRFKTTLSKLGVSGLHQSEIVLYKKEVNVILNAADDTDFEGLKKPTNEAVKINNLYAYVHVSIFVPSRFLPPNDQFGDVISGPDDVRHGPICVRALRSFTKKKCPELD